MGLLRHFRINSEWWGSMCCFGNDLWLNWQKVCWSLHKTLCWWLEEKYECMWWCCRSFGGRLFSWLFSLVYSNSHCLMGWQSVRLVKILHVTGNKESESSIHLRSANHRKCSVVGSTIPVLLSVLWLELVKQKPILVAVKRLIHLLPTFALKGC